MKRLFAFGALVWVAGLTILLLGPGRGVDATSFDIVAVRIVDARAIPQLRGEPRLNWGTTEPIALACYCKNHRDWWLFPVLAPTSEAELLSSSLVIRLELGDLPPRTAEPLRDLIPGRPLQFRSAEGCRITLSVSLDNPRVGDVHVECQARGLEIDYYGTGVLIY